MNHTKNQILLRKHLVYERHRRERVTSPLYVTRFAATPIRLLFVKMLGSHYFKDNPKKTADTL